MKTKNLYYICLEPGHIAKFCSSGYVCKRCDKKHHVSICSYDPRSPLNSQQTHQNDSTLSNFSSNQNNILLQTAYVEVTDLELKNKHFVNALFDSGSQRTYISSDLRNKLGLKTLRKERIFIKKFGNKNSSALSVDVIPLKLISDQKIVTIEAICTSVICADLLNQNIQHISTRYPHLTGLKTLSENIFNDKLDSCSKHVFHVIKKIIRLILTSKTTFRLKTAATQQNCHSKGFMTSYLTIII